MARDCDTHIYYSKFFIRPNITAKLAGILTTFVITHSKPKYHIPQLDTVATK